MAPLLFANQFITYS